MQVELENGTTVEVADNVAADFVGLTAEGYQVIDAGGWTYPLTPCCGASATGSIDGIACRGCYGDIDPTLGCVDLPIAVARKQTPRTDTFLDEPIIGTVVRVRSVGTGYESFSSGTYEGIVRSEWDGEPIHFFTGGEINGTAQGCHGFPAPAGSALTTDETPSEIVARREAS